MFRGSQASLVMIVFDLTVQINEAVTLPMSSGLMAK